LIGALLRKGRVGLYALVGRDRMLYAALVVFCAWVIVQAGLAYLRFGSLVVAGIGLLAYLSPLPALWLAYYFVRREHDIERLLQCYALCCIVVGASIYLSLLDLDWQVFKQVGEGLAIYDRYQHRYIEAHTGLMRAPDIAAWHVGTGACLLMMMAIVTRQGWLRWWIAPMVVLLVTAGLLTGRRKILMEVVVFLAMYGLLLWYFRQRKARWGIVSVIAAAMLFVSATTVLAPSQSLRQVSPYIQRGGSVFGDALERFQMLGLQSIAWAIDEVGWFGLGAGVASQGVQHFGGMRAAGAAEGGLGKITIELGVPGLILVLWLALALAVYGWKILKNVPQSNPYLTRLAYGLTALCLANVPIFMSASQIYGDPFVLMMLGWMAGFVLAVPRLQRLQARAEIAYPAGQPNAVRALREAIALSSTPGLQQPGGRG
ncbi:MAG: hypothetical protein U1F68_20370, partial [Gammaproteobacteria bacterium]